MCQGIIILYEYFAVHNIRYSPRRNRISARFEQRTSFARISNNGNPERPFVHFESAYRNARRRIRSHAQRNITLIKRPICKQTGLILLTSLPTAIIAAIVYFLDVDLSSLLGIGFAVTALMLLFSADLKGKKDISVGSALIIGLTQGLAVTPGLSRSGSTISMSRILGIEREKSITYSFLVSVPVIIGSFLTDALKGGFSFSPYMLAGCASAFFTGLLALKFMLKLFDNPKAFVIYLTSLSALVTLNDLFFKMF